jgi:hypothetical protein
MNNLISRILSQLLVVKTERQWVQSYRWFQVTKLLLKSVTA